MGAIIMKDENAKQIKALPQGISELPSYEFNNFYDYLPAMQIKKLWAVFQKFLNRNELSQIKIFEQHLQKRREMANNDILNWDAQLPNAKKGEFYKAVVKFPESVAQFWLEDISKLGLIAKPFPNNPRKVIIMGIPNAAGDYEFAFDYFWPGYAPHQQVLSGVLKLTINPDPHELWKDVPTNPQIEYFKPDCESVFFESDKKHFICASRRGRSHAHKGMPRDDDFCLAYDELGKWHILSVADGAGSALCSREGARLACQTAVKTCKDALKNTDEFDRLFANMPKDEQDISSMAKAKKLAYKILPKAALDSLNAIIAEAAKKERAVKDYATTLLLLCAKSYPAGWLLLSFQIGDGCMAALSMNGADFSAKLLATPDEGDFGGQTQFVTMQEIFEYANLMERLKVEFVPDFSALVMMTDGVSDAYFASSSKMNESCAWQKLWEELMPVLQSQKPDAELLEWLLFWSQGNHDDRTIALLI